MIEKKYKRPVYLNLLRIRMPVGAVVSILHRATGVLLAVTLPLLLWSLQQSLTSVAAYQNIVDLLRSLPAKFLLFVIVVALAHHFAAGVRHLLLDIEIGIHRRGGRQGAWLVIAIDVIIAVLIGRYLLL